MKPFTALLPLAAVCLAAGAAAQQSTPPTPAPSDSLATVLHQSAPQPSSSGQPSSLANVSVEDVSLSGALSIADGRAFIGNNGAIAATDKTVHVSLTRGGNLNVCASTKIHLSTDITISGGGLMIALDRGALEAHYLPGEYSDVLLTPDLRILISGPGQADFSLRVNNQGDTCIDNHGDHAPYILASSLFEGGAYRVQPNQRVLFEHGSLQQVVDNEKESCGCPPPEPTPQPTSIARVGAPGANLHTSDDQNATPTPQPPAATTAARNPFPLAESEGLKAPPPPPSTPIVPAGETHAQVTVPLVYNGETAQNVGMPASSLSAPRSGSAPTARNPPPNAACNDPLYPGVVCDAASAANPPTPKPANQPSTPPTAKKKKSNGFAHFLHKVFLGS
ncbi:MAG TPA: hypothetical protein VHZ25_09950 [Acidobacteriaceae bacterium]|jgi:hypothetical protein|nr:hypothetical protein [Acidobacteriaceae bacterium]